MLVQGQDILTYFRWKNQRLTRPVDFGEVGLDPRLSEASVNVGNDSVELLHKRHAKLTINITNSN